MCTLHEGDEFGKLALINESVRSASVQLREDNCRFLRIERQDFKRILLSIESSTVKLKEHGKEVLILEKTGLGRWAWHVGVACCRHHIGSLYQGTWW